MKTLGKWYVIVAVVCFTFMVPVFGHTPAGWALSAIGWVASHAPRTAGIGGR